MKKRVYIIILTLLLVGGAVLCAVRWQAWFGMPQEPEWTGDTIDSVLAYPDARVLDQDTLTFLVLGDIHSQLDREDYDSLAARVLPVDAVIQVGDWLDRGQEYYRQQLLHEWTNSALNGTPVIACPGNHEYNKGLSKRLSEVWKQTFAHPENGPVGVPGVSYSLNFENLLLVVIDTNPLDRLVYLTRTLTWLRNLMNQANANDQFVVVVMHHPVLSAGKGRFNALIYSTFRHALGEADLVLAGHDHSYMRRAPFVVLNTAGRPKQQRHYYTPDVTDIVPVYGVLKISHLPSPISHLQFSVYRLDDGTLIDSFDVKHD